MKQEKILHNVVWSSDLASAVDAADIAGAFPRQLELMEAAGKSVAAEVMRRWLPQKIEVLAGPGNNGGDAIVAARHLAQHGYEVRLCLVMPTGVGKASKANLAQQKRLATESLVELTGYQPGYLSQVGVCRDRIVIDGILGLGVKGALRPGLLRSAVEELASCEATIVSIDMPSGFEADGCSHPDQLMPLQASLTVSFGAKKAVHCLAPTSSKCGEVVVTQIFRPEIIEGELARHRCTLVAHSYSREKVKNLCTQLPADAHKYERGHVMVWGASRGKTGALVLSGLAALRAGAGWVTLATSSAHFGELTAGMPAELTAESVPEGAKESAAWLSQFVQQRRVKAVVVGPGWVSQELTEPTLRVLEKFVADGGFLVLDAGALTQDLLKMKPLFSNAGQRVLLTPHPGEWAKLGLSESPSNLQGINLARDEVARLISATLVYKGATPVVLPAAASMPAVVLRSGSNILARAGSGDVISGVSAAISLRAKDAAVAFCTAYELVARAASDAARVFGRQSVLASDIISLLGKDLE